jgi:hypothetical protein
LRAHMVVLLLRSPARLPRLTRPFPGPAPLHYGTRPRRAYFVENLAAAPAAVSMRTSHATRRILSSLTLRCHSAAKWNLSAERSTSAAAHRVSLCVCVRVCAAFCALSRIPCPTSSGEHPVRFRFNLWWNCGIHLRARKLPVIVRFLAAGGRLL